MDYSEPTKLHETSVAIFSSLPTFQNYRKYWISA